MTVADKKRVAKTKRLIKNRPFGHSYYFGEKPEHPIGEVLWRKAGGYNGYFFEVSVQEEHGETHVAKCAEKWMAEAIVKAFKRKR